MLTGQRRFTLIRRLALRYLGWLVNETRLPHESHQQAAGELAAALAQVDIPREQITAILSKSIVPIVPFEVTHRTLEKIPDKREVQASFAVCVYEANKHDASSYAQALAAVNELIDPILKADYLARLYSEAHLEIATQAMALLPNLPKIEQQFAVIEVYAKLGERGCEAARERVRSLVASLPLSFADRAGEFLARLGTPVDIAAAKAKISVAHPPYRIWAALVQQADTETIAEVKALTLTTDLMRIGILPIWLKLAAIDGSFRPKLLGELARLDRKEPTWFALSAQAALLFPEANLVDLDAQMDYLKRQIQKNNITEVQPVALLVNVLRKTARIHTLPATASLIDIGFGMDLPVILAEVDESKKLQLLRGYVDRDEISREEAQQIKNVLLSAAAPKKGKAPATTENFQMALEALFALSRHDPKLMSDITNPTFVKPNGSQIKMVTELKDILYLAFVNFRDERSFSFRPQQLALEYAMQIECKPEVAIQIVGGLSQNFYLERGLQEYFAALQKAGWSPAQCVELMVYVYETYEAVPEAKVLQVFATDTDLSSDLTPQFAAKTADMKALLAKMPPMETPYQHAADLQANPVAVRIAYYLEHNGKQKYREVANYSFAKFSKQLLMTAHMLAAPDIMAQYAKVCESAATMPKDAWREIEAKLLAGVWPFSHTATGDFILTATLGRKKDQKFTIAYIPGVDLLASFRFADGVGSCLVSRNKMRHLDMTYMAMSPFSVNFTMQDDAGINVGFVTCTLGLITLADGTQEPVVIANQLYCAETEARMNPDSRLAAFTHQWIQNNFARYMGAKHYLVAFQDLIGHEHLSVTGLDLAKPTEFKGTMLLPVVDRFYCQSAITHIHYDYGEKANTAQPPQAGKVYHVSLSGLGVAAATNEPLVSELTRVA